MRHSFKLLYVIFVLIIMAIIGYLVEKDYLFTWYENRDKLIETMSSNDSSNQIDNENVDKNNNVDIEKRITINEKELYLPKLDGKSEVSDNQIMKEYIRNTTLNNSTNVLGFYINSKKKDEILDNPYEAINSYVKVLTVANSNLTDAKNEQLDVISKSIDKKIKRNPELVNRVLENKDYDTEIKQPVGVDSYRVRDNAYTHIMMMKKKNRPIRLLVSNYIIIKKRMLMVIYSIRLNTIESVKEFEKNNNQMINDLISVNNF